MKQQQPNLFSEAELDAMVASRDGRPMIKTTDCNGNTFYRPDNRKTLADFEAQAREVHGDKYDYSESRYIDNKSPITIYCPKHDYHFKVGMAQNHLMKHNATGCPVCKYEEQFGVNFGTEWRTYLEPSPRQCRVRLKKEYQAKKKSVKTPEQLNAIRARQEARAKAAEERKRQREEVKARRKAEREAAILRQKEETRRRHEAERAERQRQNEELRRQRIADLQERVRREAPLKQGEGYIYKGIEQITAKQSTVMVHCPNPDHQWHPMRVDLILQGCKCRECAGRHQPVEKRCADFIAKSKKKFKDMFDYSRVPSQYVNNDTEVEIRCVEHNYWFHVTPDTHQRKYGGCPICNMSKGELRIYLWLKAHNIPFEHNTVHMEHTNLFCKVSYLVPDFVLADYNLIIEYNGEQHYEDVEHFRRDKSWCLEDQQERDRTLRDLCREQKIKLVEIHYEQFDDIEKILENLFPKAVVQS